MSDRFTITLANHDDDTFEVCANAPSLETLEEHGVSLPYGCRYGGCISCAAKLLHGEVDQSAGVALKGHQLADGYVLLCIALPLSNCTIAEGSSTATFRKPLNTAIELDLSASVAVSW